MKYVSIPTEIDAVLFTGDNFDELIDFTDGQFQFLDEDDRCEDPDCKASVYDMLHSTWILVYDGQYIIKGTKGEFYPCDAEVFRQKYRPV